MFNLIRKDTYRGLCMVVRGEGKQWGGFKGAMSEARCMGLDGKGVNYTEKTLLFLASLIGPLNNINQQLLLPFPINCLTKSLFQEVEENPQTWSGTVFGQSELCCART